MISKHYRLAFAVGLLRGIGLEPVFEIRRRKAEQTKASVGKLIYTTESIHEAFDALKNERIRPGYFNELSLHCRLDGTEVMARRQDIRSWSEGVVSQGQDGHDCDSDGPLVERDTDNLLVATCSECGKHEG